MTPTPSTSAAGFARLGDLLPMTVTIARGDKRVMLAAADIEARLAVPGIAARLAAILADPGSEAAETALRGKGGAEKLGLFPNANAVKNSLNALAFREEENSEEPSGGARDIRPVDNHENERRAHHLANALGGHAALVNIAFYRKVVRTVPHHVVQDALTRALDAMSVRKSRAHLFAFLLRPHLADPSLTNRTNPC